MLSLAAAGHRNKLFAILGTMSGTRPGFGLGRLRVPIHRDAYTTLLLAAPNALVIPRIGVLDGRGMGSSGFVLPAGAPSSLAGLRPDHAYVVIDPRRPSFDLGSNPVPLLLTR